MCYWYISKISGGNVQKYSKYKNFFSKVADMEKLPFKNESFDVICSAGSLSYGDNNRVINEIYRVLKLGGGGSFGWFAK